MLKEPDILSGSFSFCAKWQYSPTRRSARKPIAGRIPVVWRVFRRADRRSLPRGRPGRLPWDRLWQRLERPLNSNSRVTKVDRNGRHGSRPCLAANRLKRLSHFRPIGRDGLLTPPKGLGACDLPAGARAACKLRTLSPERSRLHSALRAVGDRWVVRAGAQHDRQPTWHQFHGLAHVTGCIETE